LIIPSQATAETELENLAKSIQPRTWAKLDTIGFTFSAIHSSGEDGSIFHWANDAAWDSKRKQLFFIGKAWATRPYRFVSYDSNTNTWIRLPDPYWFKPGYDSGHGYGNNAICSNGDYFYHLKTYTDDVYRYDILNETWTKLPDGNFQGIDYGEALECFPEMGGLIRVYYRMFYFWEEAKGSWTQIASNLGIGDYDQLMIHNPVHGVMLAAGGYDVNGQGMVKLEKNRLVTKLKNAPYSMSDLNCILTVDPVSGDHLVIFANGNFYRYDIISDIWEKLSDSTPWGANGDKVVAAPIRELGVVMFVRGLVGENGTVWIYKHSSAPPTPIDRTPPGTPSGLRVMEQTQ
jgi:hypothetical protein